MEWVMREIEEKLGRCQVAVEWSRDKLEPRDVVAKDVDDIRKRTKRK